MLNCISEEFEDEILNDDSWLDIGESEIDNEICEYCEAEGGNHWPDCIHSLLKD